jgi:predicted ferric reductase
LGKKAALRVLQSFTDLAPSSLILLNVGFGLPILLSWARFLPGVSSFYARITPYIIYPSLIRRYNVRPLPFSLGNAPTIGQGLYIAVLIVLNIILTAINYKTTPAHLWFQNTSQQIAGYMMYRTGVLSFAMAPLVFLFSGRNNLLQWITNWPHSTFLLLHRWIARLFVLQALLHTVLAVGVYAEMGIYSVQAKLPYWAWGVVGTFFACIMLITSTLFFRRLSYEIFLISHIIMAALVIIGSWYHVVLRFDILDGFTMWLWTACAVWFFDRLVRVIRMVKIGSRRAKVTEIGEGYVRIDVSRVRWGSSPGQKVYIYFPSLNPLRPWENHPFSVLPSSLLMSSNTSRTDVLPRHDSVSDDSPAANDIEKRVPPTTSAIASEATELASGITLFIRKSAGMTKALRANDSLFTLLEGPYPNSNHSTILKCDRIILFAGGIGITGTLPWTSAHHNIKLCWSVKQDAECLVQALDGVLQRVQDKAIIVGARTDIETALAQEVATGWEKIGVVACGPGALCDDVRAAVAAAGRKHKTIFELEVDAYSW